MKKRLSEQQEFEILKLVLDKFLWIGFIFIGFGLYQMFATSILVGLIWSVVGILLLILFMLLLIKEYELIR